MAAVWMLTDFDPDNFESDCINLLFPGFNSPSL